MCNLSLCALAKGHDMPEVDFANVHTMRSDCQLTSQNELNQFLPTTFKVCDNS